MLRDVLQRDDMWGEAIGSGGLIAVDEMTSVASGYISHDQISGELSDERWNDVADLVDALSANNTTRVRVSLTEPIEGIVVRDSDVPLSMFTFRATPPTRERSDNLRGRIVLWSPALSADEKRALVRFQFGPTAHGATGTYFLIRDGAGNWRISWSDLARYA